MGVDAMSTASFDSTADKKAVKSKTKRATKDEVAAKRVAELAKLKGADLTRLSVAKRAAIAAKIGELEAQIKVDELSIITIEILKLWVRRFQCNKKSIFRRRSDMIDFRQNCSRS